MDLAKEILLILNDKIECKSVKLGQKLAYDSLEFVNITIAIENKFNFEFEDDDLFIEDFTIPEDFIEYTSKKMTN